MSCAVAPGFEFDDFEIAGREDLSKQFGMSAESIQMIEAHKKIMHIGSLKRISEDNFGIS